MVDDDARPTLRELIVGDLGPARRHVARLLRGDLKPSTAVLEEIRASIERCVTRVEHDVK
jgi:hypothetical protein